MYLYTYYMAACFGLGSLTVLATMGKHRGATELRTLAVVVVFSAYFIGMLRSKGVDFVNYQYAYNVDAELIPDLGFRSLIILFNVLGLPIELFMVAIGVVSAYALRRAASHFNVSFAALLILWFLHIAVIRDLAQLRIGMAISIALFAITSRRRFARIVFYITAVSVHYSTLAFVLAYETCAFLARLKSVALRRFALLALLGFTLAAGKLLSALSFLDERIELYMQWEQSGYGSPVETYGSLLLHSLIIAFALAVRRRWRESVEGRTLLYLEILGVVSFIALSATAMFAFRISNALLSLYPVLFLLCLSSLRVRWADRPCSGLAAAVVLLLFGCMLLIRPGSLEIINRVGF